MEAHPNGDYDALVAGLQGFVARYDLSVNGRDDPRNSMEKEVGEEELELVAYLDLS